MNLSLPVCKQPQPLISFTGGINTGSINFKSHKEKVVIVMGATGTGKSKLSIDLATHVPAEIINSDKMQVYKGLDIVTNKVTEEECRGVPHHLLRIVDPDADYTATDFRQHALLAIESIIEQDKLPIIAGGSNSFIESLVNDDPYFASRYECCFLWVDVSLPILHRFVSKRVDQMVEAGLVEEVKALFDHQSDYTRGIRRAIGVPELDTFLRAQGYTNLDPETLDTLLQEAVDQIKENTYKLACRQLQKIHRLRDFWGWNLHRIDATEAFLHQGKEANKAWERLVVDPSAMILAQFLYRSRGGALSKPHGRAMIPRTVSPMAAMAAATH
ncbi:adenylate isopentenyltransferase 5, chloroplastic-like [Silene latifolia]|uniref:adenylate isopentenyltransferase 5, chloroplastic-like n=1 Tax=Silene latifolia TaxID=37657 RepID=UPI003D7892C2